MAHNGAEHSLDVEGRSDRLTDLAQRSQLANRLCQFVRAGFQFLEEPNVLDGDYCLRSKRLQKLDLRRRERAHLHATRKQSSNKFALLKKGNTQIGAKYAAGPQRWEIILCVDVGNVKRAMFAYPAKLWRIHTYLEAKKRYGTKMRARNHHIALAESQDNVINSTNPGSALNDGIEHRLHVCR